jgi:MFS family permease
VPGFFAREMQLQIGTQMITVICQGLGYFSVAVYISPYASSLGYSSFVSQLSIALFNVAGAAGQLGVGWASDRKPYALVMLCTSFVAAIIALLVWGFSSASLGVVLLFAILFGAVGAGFSCVS